MTDKPITPITPEMKKQIVRFTEDAANKAAKEVLAGLSLNKDTVQKAVIERGDELQAALMPVISGKLAKFLAERSESFEVMKSNIFIKSGGSTPYFDEQYDYWVNFWRTRGIKNPNFAGINPFAEKAGHRPLVLPKNDIITPQYFYDCNRERFNCWKWCSGSLDEVVVKNDRDPRAGAYVVWFRDRIEADKELKNISAIELERRNIPGITFLEREVMEGDHFERTDGHLDINNWTLCSGSRFADGRVPSVDWGSGGGGLSVDWYDSVDADDVLRARQAVS